MMNKQQKKDYVEEMKKVFTSNEAVMIAHYQGLNVNELDKIRDAVSYTHLTLPTKRIV